MRLFEDIINLLFSILGGMADIGITVFDKYVWIAQKSLKPFTVAVLASLCLILLSDATQYAWVNSVAILILGLIAASGFLLLLPVLLFAEFSAQFKPVRKLLNRFGFIVGVATALAFLAPRLPAGIDGFAILVAVFILLLGLLAFGFRPSRKTLGVQLILTASYVIAAAALPQTSASVSFGIGNFDTSLSRWVSTRPDELRMSLDVLTGKDEQGPALFNETGAPFWWCREDEKSESGYRCFSRPGRDQTTQEELVPINPNLIRTAMSNIQRADELHNFRQQQEKEKQTEQEAKRESELAQEKRARERALYIGKYVASRQTVGGVAWAIFGDASVDSPNVDWLLLRLEPEYNRFLATGALDDGVFERLRSGQVAEIAKLGLEDFASKLLLGKFSQTTENINSIAGASKVELTLQLVAINVRDGRIIKSATLLANGAGQSQQLALNKSISNLQKQLSDFLDDGL